MGTTAGAAPDPVLTLTFTRWETHVVHFFLPEHLPHFFVAFLGFLALALDLGGIYNDAVEILVEQAPVDVGHEEPVGRVEHKAVQLLGDFPF